MNILGLLTEIIWNLRRLVKGVLKFLLPYTWRRSLNKWIKPDRGNAIFERIFLKNWEDARHTAKSERVQTYRAGINIIGYFRSTTGLGEAARSSVNSADAAGIPYAAIDFERGIPTDMLVDGSFSKPFSNDFEFRTNLLHVNAEMLPYLWRTYPKDALVGRYNIAVWYWELAEFPQRWHDRFRVVDELWAATTFIQETLQKATKLPVLRIPPSIHVTVDENLRRADFGLPDNLFLFLCAYDTFSVQERKNPRAVIDSFKRAFPQSNNDVGLVIKINNAADQQTKLKSLKEELKAYHNCFFIEEVMPKIRFNSMINLVDSFISLHHSEGFGLIPAESMYLGKPVIATNWSGNTDFTLPDNSCPVNYRLVKVGRNSGPYQAEQIWAEADMDHAVDYMRRLVSDRAYYQNISISARNYIHTHYSGETQGKLMNDRLAELDLL